MKILITGGCGFLGTNLAIDAISRGDQVILFDNLFKQGSRLNLLWLEKRNNLSFVFGDIRNYSDISSVIREHQPDVIYHLAGQVAMTTSIANPTLDFETNTVGTHNLLESVRNLSPKSIVIYSSTNKVYGDLEQYQYKETDTRYICDEHPRGFGEETQLDFHSPYGCSKGSADQFMLDYSRIYGTKTVVFRHSSMYGGRQYATYDQGWIGWFCMKALEQKKNGESSTFTISGNGKQVRDVLHSEDMNRLYRAAVENIDSAKGQAFNIGGGFENSLSLLELFNELEDICDVKLNYTKLPVRESDQKYFVANINKAETLLKWKPTVTYEEGIRKMVGWLESQSC